MKLSNIFIIAIVVFASAGAAQYLFKSQDLAVKEKMTAASMQDDLNRVQAIIDEVKQDSTALPSAPKAQMHKCVKGETTVYTDEVCPKGMKEQAINNGTYNVISSVKGDAPKKETQASTMHDKALQQQLGDGY